jgi:pSer/pThr/pTyr-binding forkhead associated (FHA) protein
MPRLLIEGPSGRTEVFTLSLPQTTLGRAPGNNVVLDDPRASRFHAVIAREANFFIISDLFSRNGLQVNGRNVHASALQSGDTVTIGDCQARFIADDDFHEIVAEAPQSLPGVRDSRVQSTVSKLQTR